MGISAGLFMKKFGYKNGVLLGLLLYATGAFLFVPATNDSAYYWTNSFSKQFVLNETYSVMPLTY